MHLTSEDAPWQLEASFRLRLQSLFMFTQGMHGSRARRVVRACMPQLEKRGPETNVYAGFRRFVEIRKGAAIWSCHVKARKPGTDSFGGENGKGR